MDTDIATEYCETLLRHFVNDLSEWEDGFVRDVQRQVKATGSLSSKQGEVLDRLMAKHADRHGKTRRDTEDD